MAPSWNVAFEQAGFRNAIEAKECPAGDSTMGLEDARFSVIRYYASHIPNAYGPRSQTEELGDDPVKASTYGIMQHRVLWRTGAYTAIMVLRQCHPQQVEHRPR